MKKTALILLIVVLIAANSQTLLGLYFLNKGAELLNRQEIDTSIEYLDKSSSLLHLDPLPLRYMARAYFLKNETAKAIQILEQASKKYPDSLLVKQDLLDMYQKIGVIDVEIESFIGYTFNRGIEIGDFYLESYNYKEAKLWFDMVYNRSQEHRKDLIFRRLVTSVALESDASYIESLASDFGKYFEDFTVLDIDSQKLVTGSELRWVLPENVSGLRANHPYDYSHNAMMWWSGRTSLLFTSKTKGLYLIHLRLFADSDLPAKFLIGVNGHPKYFFLITGYQELAVPIPVCNFYSTLDIWFLDGEVSKEGDKNLFVQQIRFSNLFVGLSGC